MRKTILSVAVIALIAGCQSASTRPDPGAPSAEQLMRAAPARAPQSTNFELLWNASAQAARAFHFVIDRQDRRNGVMTSLPMTTAQWFEPWRQDNQTLGDVAVSSLATLRRTVRFEFVQSTQGDTAAWTVQPKVLVERQSKPESRVTSSAQYRSVLRPTPSATPSTLMNLSIHGPNATATTYWYPISRDAALERELARQIEVQLR